MSVNKQRPTFSIITVCLNAPHLEDTCEGVIKQTFQDFEWIVIDGGSNTETLNIFNKYSDRINYFVSEKDEGIFDAMNKGVIKSNGLYLNFMNAGDTFYNSFVLETVNSFLNELENIFVLYGDAICIKNSKTYIWTSPDKLTEDYFYISSLSHQSTFINRNAFVKYGLYNIAYKYISDRIFFYNLFRNNEPFKKINVHISKVDFNSYNSSFSLEALKENRQFRNTFAEDVKERNRILIENMFTQFIKSIRTKHL